MIVITGAAGFIASFLAKELNEQGYSDLIIVDEFSIEKKKQNHKNLAYKHKVSRNEFFQWFESNKPKLEFIFHLGARTDTTEMDYSIHNELNVEYSKSIWNLCIRNKIPLIYASSAATYGLGEYGYSDNHEMVKNLKPLNPYGDSKNNFDKWVLEQDLKPPFWAGLKFFNVYGPHESHKGRMASVVYHAYHQIKTTGGMKLFRSHNPKFKDGEQLRDFIYVKDVVSIIEFMHKGSITSGLYNVGTGEARTFYDLAKLTFLALNKDPDISFIDTPEDIRNKYQYFTEADMTKLKEQGYNSPFHTLEEGVEDYVKNYLST